MGVLSTLPTSRRCYLSQTELAQFADTTVTDTTEADDRISQAEEIIDAYVGPQGKFLDYDIYGLAASGASTSLTLESAQQNTYDIDFFKWTEIEIVGGTGVGQRRTVTGSTKEGVLTVAAWTVTPGATSFYRIYQLGKYPRYRDVITYSTGVPTQYYKQIPEAIKRATAAQVEYIIAMGDNFFKTDQSDKVSESIGDYSYENSASGVGKTGVIKLIAPKARTLLKGYVNRTGQIVF